MSYAADLDLAVACAAGDARAIDRLETLIENQADMIARVDRSRDFVTEIQQRVRLRLLMGANDGRPRIADYAGRGPLAAFVRVAAVRLALMEKRSSNRNRVTIDSGATSRTASEPPVEVSDADLRELEVALRRALASLDPRERTAMRMSYFDQLNINEIASAFGVHRATAARWLTRSLAHLRDVTLAELQRRLGLSRSEAATLVADLIRHVSLDAWER
jgi:RNA polymerase sigma-70 factor (ECF subfamily)